MASLGDTRKRFQPGAQPAVQVQEPPAQPAPGRQGYQCAACGDTGWRITCGAGHTLGRHLWARNGGCCPQLVNAGDAATCNRWPVRDDALLEGILAPCAVCGMGPPAHKPGKHDDMMDSLAVAMKVVAKHVRGKPHEPGRPPRRKGEHRAPPSTYKVKRHCDKCCGEGNVAKCADGHVRPWHGGRNPMVCLGSSPASLEPLGGCGREAHRLTCMTCSGTGRVCVTCGTTPCPDDCRPAPMTGKRFESITIDDVLPVAPDAGVWPRAERSAHERVWTGVAVAVSADPPPADSTSGWMRREKLRELMGGGAIDSAFAREILRSTGEMPGVSPMLATPLKITPSDDLAHPYNEPRRAAPWATSAADWKARVTAGRPWLPGDKEDGEP